jgi:hypothetical protein
MLRSECVGATGAPDDPLEEMTLLDVKQTYPRMDHFSFSHVGPPHLVHEAMTTQFLRHNNNSHLSHTSHNLNNNYGLVGSLNRFVYHLSLYFSRVYFHTFQGWRMMSLPAES